MIIYKVINLLTSDIYIGQTKKGLYERKRDHVYEAFGRKLGDKFHSAIREFGVKNFKWEILNTGTNYTELSKLESALIQKYKAIEYGYNTSVRCDTKAVGRINKKNYKNGFKSIQCQ